MIQIAGQTFRVGIVLLHIRHDVAEQVGRFLGNLLHRPVGPELAGSEEGAAQFDQMFRLVQSRNRDFVQDGFHAREIGADEYVAKRRDDEQGRRFQVNLIAQQLVESSRQLVITTLELPAETLLEVGVSKAAGHRLLKGEHVGVAVGHRAGMADQGADVEEHFLRRLLLAKADVMPLGDKLLWSHTRYS